MIPIGRASLCVAVGRTHLVQASVAGLGVTTLRVILAATAANGGITNAASSQEAGAVVLMNAALARTTASDALAPTTSGTRKRCALVWSVAAPVQLTPESAAVHPGWRRARVSLV